MTSKTFNVACVGAGYFAQFHHAAWQHVSGANLVAVVDRDPNATMPDNVDRYIDLGALLADRAIDVLDIATPPETHSMMIEQAIGAGVTRIICQKPFCGALDVARRVAARAAADGVDLIVHDNFRFQPWYRRLKAILEDGSLGRVHQINFALRPGDGRGASAYLDRQPYFQTMDRFLVHETAVHFLDVFAYLLGLPDHVYADLRRLNPHIAGEDAGLIILGYEDGRRAVFDGNRLMDHAADNRRLTMGEALVEAEEACIRLDGYGRLHRRGTGEADWQQIWACEPDDRFGGGCVEALCQHAVDAWHRGARPENDAASYLQILELEEQVYESARAGARISRERD